MKRVLLALAILLTAWSATAEARCQSRAPVGTWAVQVQGFSYDFEICNFVEGIDCGTESFLAFCEFAINRIAGQRELAVTIDCPGRIIPSSGGGDRSGSNPFEPGCLAFGGSVCPEFKLYRIQDSRCSWNLSPYGEGAIIYRLTFAADRQSFIGGGALGSHSSEVGDGDSGTTLGLTGLRQ